MPTDVFLSVCPGIDLLGLAIQEIFPEACVVRGPDVIFGSLHDIRRFHAPPGVFRGVFGGTPCQVFSRLKHLNPRAGEKHGNLIPEFERVVGEAQPEWFLLENVPRAPEPCVDGYVVRSLVLNNRWLGEVQERERRFSFGTRDGRALGVDLAPLESFDFCQAVTSSARLVPVKLGGSGKVKRTYTADGKRHGPSIGARMPIGEMLRLQGAPPDLLDEAPWTDSGKRKAIGNAVPIPMGRAIARAIKRAMDGTLSE